MNNMRVGFIKSRINFRGNNDNVIAYDDSVSKQRREFIREHYNSWHTPTIDIYEKEPQQTEYGLQKIINRLRTQPKKIVDKNLLPYSRRMKIDRSPKTNSYRGESLVDAPISELKQLKEAGIRTVIDLVGYGDRYKEKVEKAGLEFFSFPLNWNFWEQPMFTEKLKESDDRTGINKFIEFINKMQQDYVYIGCEFGTYKTDDALTLNSFFNPKANKHSIYMREACQELDMRTLFSNLNKEDLKKLGWDKEYKLKFLIMLKQAQVDLKHLTIW